MNLGPCESCKKTVYDTEAVRVGGVSDPKVFHKKCFKCSNPGCTWKLDYGNYTYYEGKAYCKNHNPMTGFSNADVQAKGVIRANSYELNAAKSAPKLDLQKGVYQGASFGGASAEGNQ